MNLTGGNQRRFAGHIGGIDPGAEGVGIGVPTLTADGREVLVPLRGATAITLATGARRPLSFCAGAALWSPDGKEFICSGRSFTAPIYIVDHRGGPKRALPGTKSASPDAWSRDGRWILFEQQDGYGPYYLWRIHPDGTGLHRISRFTPMSDVLWLPDGRAEFVATRSVDVSEFGKLIVLDVDSGKAKVLRQLPSPDTAVWSPDGRTLAFAASDNGQRPSTLHTVNVHGGALRRLTPPGEEQYDESPTWSPDGKNLVFVRQLDGGAGRYASEIWTMRADGSHQRQLTQPYPDGGENVEPVWVSGPIHSSAPPHVAAAQRALRVPYLVAGVAAHGARVAVAPFGHAETSGAQPTPPLLVWRPGSQPESLVGSLCGSIAPDFFVGQRLAIACDHDFLDEHQQAVLVFDLRTRIPVEPIHAYNANFGAGTQSGTVVDGPVLSGGRIEFESSPWAAASRNNKLKRSRLPRQILWAAHGSHRAMLRSAHRLGSLLAGDRAWLVFTVTNGIEITSPNGHAYRLLHLPALHLGIRALPPGFLIVGDELIRLGGGRLEGWDVRNGRVLVDRNVSAKAQLQAANSQYIAYTAGADIHLVSRTGDHVIHTPAVSSHELHYYGEPPLHAALSSAGLFYAYDLKGGAFPGRVVFLPRRALPR